MSKTPTNTGTIRHTNSQGSDNVNDVVETEATGGASHAVVGANVIDITPSDVTVYDPPLIGLRVGTLAGNISVVSDGDTVVIPSWQLYEALQMNITKVLAATTATGITGWQGS